MSDAIKHECGISLNSLIKPLSYYQRKIRNAFYGVNKNVFDDGKAAYRGQDGAGLQCIKLDIEKLLNVT